MLNVKLSARQTYFIIKLKSFSQFALYTSDAGICKKFNKRIYLKNFKFPFQPKNFEKSDSAFYCMRACARIQKPSFSRTRSILRLTFLLN